MEIDDKRAKMRVDEIFDEMKDQPVELNFINEKTAFKTMNENDPIFYKLKSFEKETSKVYKVMKLSDLKKINQIIGGISDGDITHWNPGGGWYIYLENDEITLKKMKKGFSEYKFETRLGNVICRNAGEWGGSIYI